MTRRKRCNVLRLRTVLRLLSLAGLLVSAGGANCTSLINQPWETPRWLTPCELGPDATLADYLTVVNYNSGLVDSLYSENVEISAKMPGQLIPSLKAKLAFQKGRRFRLLATGPTGTEVDMGSNDEEFWFWLLRSEPKALYFCRYEDYGRRPMRMAMPFQPEWIIEALGVTPLGTEDQFEGPVRTGSDRVEIRTTRRSPQGRETGVRIVLDSCNGWIREQHLFDDQGRLVAKAVLSGHRREPKYYSVIPGRVDLSWPETGLSLAITLRDVVVNEIPAGPQLWQRPHIEGYPEVDLCNPTPAGARLAPRRPTDALALPRSDRYGRTYR